MGANHVKLYVSPDCDDCDRAKSFLEDQGIKYEEINIREPGPREELKHKTGRAQCPSIYVGGRFYCGLGKIEKSGKTIVKQLNDMNIY